MRNGVVERVFQLAVFGHGGRADLRSAVLAHNADHLIAVGGRPESGLGLVGSVIKTLFIHRQAARRIVNYRTLRRGHGHVDAFAPAVAVRVRNGEGEAVRASNVRLGRVAVGAVSVYRQRAVLARHSHTFTGQRVALALAVLRRDGEALPFAVVSAEVEADLAFNRLARPTGGYGLNVVPHAQRRNVIDDLQPYFSAGAVTVRISNGNDKIMVELIVIPVFVMGRGFFQNKDIVQTAGGFVEREFKMAAVYRDGSARHRAVLKDGNAAKNDGSNAIGSGDEHIPGRFRVRFRSPVLFRDTKKTIPDTGSTRSNGDGIVNSRTFIRAKGFQIVKRDVAVRPAHI